MLHLVGQLLIWWGYISITVIFGWWRQIRALKYSRISKTRTLRFYLHYFTFLESWESLIILCFMFLWPCIVSKAWRKNTNKIQQYRYLLSIQMFNIDYCLDMFRVYLCPSSGEKYHVLLHMGLFAGIVGCGWLRYCGATVWLLWRLLLSSNLNSAHTLQRSTTTATNHIQHYQQTTPYAVTRGLFLLMIGINIPETCGESSQY